MQNLIDVMLLAGGNTFDLIGTVDAQPLRSVSRAFRNAVRDHPWNDTEARVTSRPEQWRAAHTSARTFCSRTARPSWVETLGSPTLPQLAVLILDRSDLSSLQTSDFKFFAGVHTLSLVRCRLGSFEADGFNAGAAFEALRQRSTDFSLRRLNLDGNAGVVVTDAALAALAGVSVCHLAGTRCSRVTPAGLVALRAAAPLSVFCASHSGLIVSDAALHALRGTVTLRLSGCHLGRLTAAGLAHVGRGSGTRELFLGALPARTPEAPFSSLEQRQPTLLCDEDMALLSELSSLDVSGWSDVPLSDAGLCLAAGPRLEWLSIVGCTQRSITPGIVSALAHVRVVLAAGCTQLSDAVIASLARADDRCGRPR